MYINIVNHIKPLLLLFNHTVTYHFNTRPNMSMFRIYIITSSKLHEIVSNEFSKDTQTSRLATCTSSCVIDSCLSISCASPILLVTLKMGAFYGLSVVQNASLTEVVSVTGFYQWFAESITGFAHKPLQGENMKIRGGSCRFLVCGQFLYLHVL